MGAPGADRRERVAAAAELFKCLSAPLRIAVIELLLERPRTVSELVEALAAPQPLISQHLRVLRDHCLVIGERSGRATTYSLMDAHVAHIVGDAIAHTKEHAHGGEPDLAHGGAPTLRTRTGPEPGCPDPTR